MRLKCRGKKTRDARAAKEWEARLERMGLGMEVGTSIGHQKITYGHRVKDLDFDGRIASVPKTGESLEQDEWPPHHNVHQSATEMWDTHTVQSADSV